MAVFSPTKHSSSCGNVTSAHLLLCYTSAVFGNGLFKGYTKNHLFFLLKIFGGPSLTVSLLWQGDYVVNQKFLRTGQDSNLRWDCSARLTACTVRPTTATRTFVGRVGFEPTSFLMYWIYSPAPFHHQSSLPIHP